MTGNAETSQQSNDEPKSEADSESTSWIEHPTTVQHLQTLVIVLGVVLIIGFATVIGRIAYLAMNSEDSNVATTAPQSNTDQASKVTNAGATNPNSARFQSDTINPDLDLIVTLPAGAHVKQITPTSDGFLVRFDDPRGTAVYLFDAETGEIKRQFRFKTKPE